MCVYLEAWKLQQWARQNAVSESASKRHIQPSELSALFTHFNECLLLGPCRYCPARQE